MAVLICKPIIEIPPRCGGIFLGRGMSKKQERKRIMGKKRMFAALLALLMTVGTLVLPAQAAFTDTAGHWAETAITKWSE